MDTFFMVLSGLLGFLFIALTVGLILVILVQRPQGGGLSGAFGAGSGSTQSAFGAKTGDVLTLVTVAVFTALIIVACGLGLVQRRNWGGTANNVRIAAPPEKLKTELQEDGTVLLSWDDMSADETGFLIQRTLQDMEEWQDLETVARNETQYIDDDVLLQGSTYKYQVSAVNEGGASEPCAESIITIPTPTSDDAAAENNNNGLAPAGSNPDDNLLNDTKVNIVPNNGKDEGAITDDTTTPPPPDTENTEDNK